MKATIFLTLATLGMLLWWTAARAGNVPQIGQTAPAFALPDQNGKLQTLANYDGQWVVLYFYPKDDTPGCTKEACNFRDDLRQIEALGAKVIGVSVDDSDSHAKFALKHHLPFPLLADRDGKLADSYGALTDLGVFKIAKRYTFLLDREGKIARIYLSVDTARHSKQIIDELQTLMTKH